jgi:2-oxoglutarate dehydrogenase E2 component (dihydrolipoamide succinyltransferase)
MTKKVELLMPQLGESIQEATILKWVKQVGDSVEADESVLEISTDKVDSDVPAPVSGTVTETKYDPDEVVSVGEPLAVIATEDEVGDDVNVIEDDGGAGAEPEPEPSPEPAAAAAEEAAPATTAEAPATASQPQKGEGSRFYSPLVLNIAKQEQISMEELETLEGTGKEGRVTKKDILQYVEDKKAGKVAKPEPQPAAQPAAQPQPEAAPAAAEPATNGKQQAPPKQPSAAPQPEPAKPDVPVYEGDEVEEMDRMRSMIADHMVRSKRTSPHVTSFVEVDMTPLVQWRERNKQKFQQQEGEKLTFTPIFIEAVVKAMKEMPGMNTAVSGNQIIRRKRMNIGLATATPSGHLIVPVIHDADTMNLIGLAKKVNDLAGRARNNKLKPEEIQGGTFTVTNVGTFGNVAGTPVINQPEAGILATGAIQKKPAVVETEAGDAIAIRHKMYLSMSYDHRIIDGAYGGTFIKRVADILENFDTSRDF